ncbi:cytochrome P450 [Macrolepiota fuliginosa MF-IS2]|uniref:Cytochrome P450 n=1 Tax=Macrolepiota fuliginosa MF-IS2 TaxID=1400762 RepID=A0A9P5XG01_9AGAR|nr:cytochrome P450 [Macrolepiota fuliginosa MF-IS2]
MFHIREFFLLGICSLVYIRYRHRRRSGPPLPPGPRRWPLVGNAFSIPSAFAYMYYHAMAKKFDTNILYLEAFGQPIVVLTDLRAAQDLLDKRSSLYSGRPHLTMLHELMDLNNMFALFPYGNAWREQRKLFQQHFSPRDMSFVKERAGAFIRKSLLPNILRSPQDYRKHLHDCFGGMAMSITYGLPVRTSGDHWVQLAEESFTIATGAVIAGKYLVDVFPILKHVPDWMPGAQFKRDAKKWRAVLKNSMTEPFEAAKEAMANGTVKHSFVSASLEKCNESSSDYVHQVRLIQEVASNVYAAAAETVVGSVLCFMLAMLKYPDIQHRAQREVDSIVGHDRLPDVSDLERLPFVSAVLKEVFRWHSISPAGVPHYLHEDDVYNGYLIPKGTVVLANTYTMLRDEQAFPKPEEFVPERFLNNSELISDVPDPEVTYTFGFGRRICPGAHIGLFNYHMTALHLLALFDLLPEVDENGKPIEVPLEFSGNLSASIPEPFPCKLTPRAGKNVERLLREFMDVEFI